MKSPTQFKLAALDQDGTLLGPDGTISPANRDAVKRMQQAGLQVVLASGRHFKTMRRFADALGGVEWIISCQGGEVADLARQTVLHTQFLPPAGTEAICTLAHAQGLSSVAYGIEGVYTVADWRQDLGFYTQFVDYQPVHCLLKELVKKPVFKIIWLGTEADIDQAAKQAPANPAYQIVRTHKRFLEFMPAGVSKASALKTLTPRLGIAPAECVVFGDGANDVPMFNWAGLSVAMAHGWPAALQAAEYVTSPGPAESALARGVDFLFAEGLIGSRSRTTIPAV